MLLSLNALDIKKGLSSRFVANLTPVAICLLSLGLYAQENCVGSVYLRINDVACVETKQDVLSGDWWSGWIHSSNIGCSEEEPCYRINAYGINDHLGEYYSVFKLTNNIYHFPVNAGDDPMTFWFWYGCCGLSPFCVDDNVQGNVFSLHANAIIIIIFGCLPQIFVGIPLFGWTCFRNVKIATGLLRIHGVCGGSMKNLYRQIS